MCSPKSSFYRWGSWGSERGCTLTEVTYSESVVGLGPEPTALQLQPHSQVRVFLSTLTDSLLYMGASSSWELSLQKAACAVLDSYQNPISLSKQKSASLQPPPTGPPLPPIHLFVLSLIHSFNHLLITWLVPGELNKCVLYRVLNTWYETLSSCKVGTSSVSSGQPHWVALQGCQQVFMEYKRNIEW